VIYIPIAKTSRTFCLSQTANAAKPPHLWRSWGALETSRYPIFGGVDPPTNDLELPLWLADYFGYAMGKWLL